MKQLDLFSNVTVDEVSLIYKSKTPPHQRISISGSKDACNAFISMWDEDTLELQEEFRILLLNRSNRVLGVTVISQGGISGMVVDIRRILQAALKSNASSIICCHNHPSGNTKPSEADRKITLKISEAAKLMDIQLLDHIIIVPGDEYFSFSDEGLI